VSAEPSIDATPAAAVPPDGVDPLRRTRAWLQANHGTHRGLVRSALAEAEFLLGRLDPHLRPDLRTARRLVFVCLGNINRSAFAEQVARRCGARTCSFGLSTTTGAPAYEGARLTAPRFDIDLGGHRATNIGDHGFETDDLLLVMEVRHARRLVARGVSSRSIALLGHWAAPHRIHLHDPHGLSLAYFRTCFTLIDSAVRALVDDARRQSGACLSR
jgi:protein-tyrosine phosphatase